MIWGKTWGEAANKRRWQKLLLDAVELTVVLWSQSNVSSLTFSGNQPDHLFGFANKVLYTWADILLFLITRHHIQLTYTKLSFFFLSEKREHSEHSGNYYSSPRPWEGANVELCDPSGNHLTSLCLVDFGDPMFQKGRSKAQLFLLPLPPSI